MRRFLKKLMAKVRLILCCDVPARFRKEPRIHFHHCVGIVVSKKAIFNGEVHIWQNVTIGGVGGKYPRIGNNVFLMSNCCVIGDVTIGDNVIVGAGSVVTKSLPSNCIAVGSPAKVLRSGITAEEVVQVVWGRVDTSSGLRTAEAPPRAPLCWYET